MPPTIAIDTLGCKLNQAETEALASQFAAAGYRVVEPSQPADVYILNTCTVTHIADRKSRHFLRMARRRNPEGLLVATGCYADRAGKELSRAGGVDLVLGNQDKPGLVPQVEKLLRRSPGPALDRCANGFRTRSFVKIQEGCSSFCAYCIVPLVRGAERSLSADDIIARINERVIRGYREVVLTGTRVGVYRYDSLDLAGLLKRILQETHIGRLRLSSLQPREISPALVRLWKDSRLCPHFHMALQSGSDAVLERMGRRYSLEEYEQAVSLVRGLVPDAAITTDVIVGFPGETAEEHQASYRFCQRLQFARIHVFPYSARTGTRAAQMKPAVSESIKKQRVGKMIELACQAAADFHSRFTGRVMPVLFESRAGDTWSGLTGNYIRVSVASQEDLGNRLLPVRLVKQVEDGMEGVLD